MKRTFLSIILLAAIALSSDQETVKAKINTSATELISIAYDDSPANGASFSPSISGDGRFVAFSSDASNLVVNDNNNFEDIFVRDRETGTTELISMGDDGTSGNGNSCCPKINSDGRFVAFSSTASNLVEEDTNGYQDVFVHDRQSGSIELVSVASDGTQANDISYNYGISANGRFVAFRSYASNLGCGSDNHTLNNYIRDRESGVTECKPDWKIINGLSGDGQYVLLRTDIVTGTEGEYVYDSLSGSYEEVGIAPPGWCSWTSDSFISGVSFSEDTRYVLLSAGCYKLAYIFVRDRLNMTTEEIYSSAFVIGSAAISSDARLVVYGPNPYDLDNSKYDLYGFDRHSGKREMVSTAFDGTFGDDYSAFPSISSNGRFVAFHSQANNLVSGDTNGVPDIFVKDRGIESTYWIYYFPFISR